MKRLIVMVVCFFLVVGFLTQASAYEYPPPFRIKHIKISNDTNFHVRAYSDNPNQWLCHNGQTWGYVNIDSSGFEAKTAVILLAYSLGRAVQVVTVGKPFMGRTFCHIEEIKILDQ
ncbi:MAG: hypothetical protein GF332_04525 [Candidatus Moranbacteria bacterium]|nr:hypothetical protein [Candidatus Moranbacteria bacterium]